MHYFIHIHLIFSRRKANAAEPVFSFFSLYFYFNEGQIENILTKDIET